MRADKDEEMWKTVYYPQVIQNIGYVEYKFMSMVENNKLYLCVRSNYGCSYFN